MRNPNGYGSVVKLSGKRRRPYAARKTIGWRDNGYPIYRYVGYYKTRKEAIIGLAKYNQNPYNLDYSRMTLKQLYEKWYEEQAVKKYVAHTLTDVRSGFNALEPVHNKVYRELTINDMELVCNNRVVPLRLLRRLDKYAVKLGITTRCNSDFVEVKKSPKNVKTVFSEEEIELLWQHRDDRTCRDALILIYTGMRVGELLSVTDDNLKDGYFVAGSKTEAGKNRVIPIHPRIADLVREFMTDDRASYQAYRQRWQRVMAELGMKHTIHECRHTCRSRLDSAGVRSTAIDLIMGHKNGSTGDRVYTHKTVEELRSAISAVT